MCEGGGELARGAGRALPWTGDLVQAVPGRRHRRPPFIDEAAQRGYGALPRSLNQKTGADIPTFFPTDKSDWDRFKGKPLLLVHLLVSGKGRSRGC